MMGIRRHAPWITLVALPVVILLPFLLSPSSPLLSRSTLGSDYLSLQLPNAQHFHEAWRSTGRFPLWQPAFFSGVPVAGNPSYLLTYPPYWMVLFLSPVLALNLLFAIHLAWAGIGTWWFARRALGFGPESAVLAGIAFALAPKVLAHVSGGQLGVVIALAWFPFALLGVWQAFESGSWLWPWLTGAALGFMVVAHSPTAWLFTPMLLAVGLWRAVACLRSVRPAPVWYLGRLSAGGAVAGIGFLAAAAAHLLPFLELLPYLHRTGITLSDAAAYSLPAAILPLILAVPSVPFPEWIIYPGAIPAMLAVLGATRGRLSGKRFWLVAAALAAVYALGQTTPIFGFVFQLPGFDLLRVPPRSWFIVAFVVAVLAGAGLEAWRENSKAMLLPGSIVLALLVASSAALSTSADGPRWAAIAAAAAAGAITLVLSRVPDSAGRWSITLVGLAALELGLAGWTFWRVGVLDPPPAWAQTLRDRLAETGGRAYTEGILPAYQAYASGVPLVEGLDPVQLASYAALMSAAAGCDTEVYSISSPPFLGDPGAARDCPNRSMDSRILGLLSTSYGVEPDGSAPDFNAGWRLEVVHTGMSFYRNEDAQPFSRLTVHVVAVPSAPTIEQVLADRDVVRVEGGIGIEGSRQAGMAQAGWVGPDRLEAHTVAEAPALLTLAIPYLPGWRAFREGVEQPVYRAQGLFLGTYVPEGRTELDFQYAPRSLEGGLGLALFAILLVGIAKFTQLASERIRTTQAV